MKSKWIVDVSPPFMVMPKKLTSLPDDLVKRVKRCRPIDLGFQPPPEAFNRMTRSGRSA